MQDDKKKMMVLGVLGVVLVGIGAFTMIPQEGPPPPSTASGWKPPVEETSTTTEEQEPAKNPSVVALLDRRDPFDVPPEMEEKREESSSQAVPPPPTPRTSGERRIRNNWRPSGLRSAPDFDFQLPGARTDVEVRPETPPTDAIKDATSNPGVTSAPPKEPEPTFDYGVNGVILGRRPAAVLTDKQGNQKLVVMGGAIDGDATLVDVRPGAVIVSIRGKRLRVEMKGDKDAN